MLQAKDVNNTIFLTAEKLIKIICILISSVILARFLGPENFGLYSYLVSVVAIIAAFSSLGLNSLITKSIADEEDQAESILNTAISLRIISSLAVTFLLVLAIQFDLINAPPQENYMLVFLTFCTSFNSLTVIDHYFIKKQRFRKASGMRASVILLSTFLKVIAAYCGGIQYLIVATGAETLLLGAGYLLIAKNDTQLKLQLKIDTQRSRTLLNQSKWLILSGLAASLNLKIDQSMLRFMLGLEETGIYAAASQISEFWYFFPAIVASIYFPKMLNERHDKDNFREILQKSCDIILLISFIIICFLFFSSEQLIALAYGASYADAAGVLKIHLWAGLFIAMRAVFSKWLISVNLLHFSLVTHGAGAACNILLNTGLIPYFGIEGAAYATVISYAASSYFALLLFKKTRPMAWVMTKSFALPFRAISRQLERK